MVNLAYGLVAASVAQLTNGFIFTDDGAWECKKFPTTPEDFFMWYFSHIYQITGMIEIGQKNVLLILSINIGIVYRTKAYGGIFKNFNHAVPLRFQFLQ